MERKFLGKFPFATGAAAHGRRRRFYGSVMATIRPRRAGVLIPTFAIRTEDDLGIGDTGGVRELIDWAADTGVGFLQFLPINATGTDSSPYNAISSVALDYLTLA